MLYSATKKLDITWLWITSFLLFKKNKKNIYSYKVVFGMTYSSEVLPVRLPSCHIFTRCNYLCLSAFKQEIVSLSGRTWIPFWKAISPWFLYSSLRQILPTGRCHRTEANRSAVVCKEIVSYSSSVHVFLFYVHSCDTADWPGPSLLLYIPSSNHFHSFWMSDTNFV